MTHPNFPRHYQGWIENALKKGNLSRDEIWTKNVAVGGKPFVDKIRRRLGFVGNRKDVSISTNSEVFSVQEDTSL